MMLFWLLVAVMVVAGLAWIVPALLHRPAAVADPIAAQAAIYRNKLQELETDLANNTLREDEYRLAKAELEREALNVLDSDQNRPAHVAGKTDRRMALAVVVLVPLAAIVLYTQLGHWRSIDQPPQQAHGLPADHPPPGQTSSTQSEAGKLPTVAEMMTRLVERLQANPADADGWILLGHSYRSIRRYDMAARAYHRAIELGRNEPELAAMYQETLAMGGGQPAEARATSIVDRVLQLQARLADHPEDAQAWAALARAYSLMKNFPDAVQAYARATALVTDSADLWADYADALASAGNSVLTGKPMELVKRALALDPDHAKALWLAATEAHNRGDFAAALQYWEHLKTLLDPAGRDAAIIQANIDEARRLAGMPALAATPAVQTPAPGGRQIRGRVELAPELQGSVPADATVFIYARAAQGPRMPLAVLRKQVSELPVDFVLDDSQAMTPAMKLSAFNDVVVSAHISRRGSAIRSSGDLEARGRAVTGEQNGPVMLTIGDTVP